jgi:hypothetical protein
MTEYRLLIAHTLIEALREQHPGLEHIDNERGDCWLPGGSTPQSAGCIIDICAIAQDIESEVLSAAPPAPTREEVARVLGKIDGAKWTDTYVQFTTPEHNGPPEKYYRMADAILALLGRQS